MLELGGLVARDSIRRGEFRGMVYAEGDFAMPRGYELSFKHYLIRQMTTCWKITTKESRGLTSDITLERVRRDERIRVQALQFRSLRINDVNDTLPNSVGQGLYDRASICRFWAVWAASGWKARAMRAARPFQPAQSPTVIPNALPDSLPIWAGGAIPPVLPGGVLGAVGVNLGLDHFRIAPAASGFAPHHHTPAPIGHGRICAGPWCGQRTAGPAM